MKLSGRSETDEALPAAFAGILEGRFLWVAVEAARGRLALRDTTGEMLSLPTEVPGDQPVYCAARIDLDALPGTGGATYDVVLVPAGGGSPASVWTGPLPSGRPQPAADGRTQLALQGAEDGALQVRRTTLTEAATVTAVSAEPDGVRLTILGPGGTVALVGDGDSVVATYAVERDGDLCRVLLTTEGAEAAAPQLTRAVLGEVGAWRPLRRHTSDLADPSSGAPLPQIHPTDGDVARMRLRWSGKALLQVRVL